MANSEKPFRVIVVGAGVVGLSLSHAFQLANIEHVVLEKHDSIVSYVGAALAILPHTARVFDQFGFLDKLNAQCTPLSKAHRRWPDGTLHSIDIGLNVAQKMFDQGLILIDRQMCVETLYENLPDKSRILTKKRVTGIEHLEAGVKVSLDDGTCEEGDIVIGADGVHSVVRQLMWDYANAFELGAIPESDKNAFFSQFAGMFGVSENSLGLGPAEEHTVFGHDTTALVFTQPGKVYWAKGHKDEYCRPPKRTRATAEDYEAYAKRMWDEPITETLKFSDLWKTRSRVGMVTIEEGILKQWHAGRIVLVGDSAHKMTADLGLGANTAIGGAVALSNILHRELKSNQNRHFTTSEISALFAEYQKKRYATTKELVDISGMMTRMHSYGSLGKRLFISYIAPLLEKKNTMEFVKLMANQPKLDYAPLRTMNEDAEGWKLANKKGNEKQSAGVLTYFLITSAVGILISYATIRGWNHDGFPGLRIST